VSQPAGVRTVAIYHCHFLRPGNIHDDYVSTDPNCEGYTNDGLLGYILQTALNRYYNPTATTHWVTIGAVTSGYYREGTLGSLLSSQRTGAQALYGCVYPNTQDHFLSTDAACGGQTVLQLEGYIYTSAPAGVNTIQLYHCVFMRPGNIRDDYVSRYSNCEGYTNLGSLGFALAAG
jgi:hypothetical protein